MEPLKKIITSWKDLYEFYLKKFYPNDAKSWLFRGENPGGKGPNDIDDKKILKSELDKAFDFFDIDYDQRLIWEKYLIRDFCRKQFLYTNYQPESNIERLTLMRHHDGPTRLMDWTYSFFVALYFAINRAENYCVVWAIDENWIEKESKKLHAKLKLKRPKDKDNTWYNEQILEEFWNDKNQVDPQIYPMTSFYLNKRLSIQRGTFLCPADIRISWYENLKKMPESQDNDPLYQIIINWGLNTEERNKIINMLFEMNINQATLFPDLDGLAMSLRTKLASPQCLPKDLKA